MYITFNDSLNKELKLYIKYFIDVQLVAIEFLHMKDLLKVMVRIMLYILLSTIMINSYECKSVGVLDNLIKLGGYSCMYKNVKCKLCS